MNKENVIKLNNLVNYLSDYLAYKIEDDGYPETFRVIVEQGIEAFESINDCKIKINKE